MASGIAASTAAGAAPSCLPASRSAHCRQAVSRQTNRFPWISTSRLARARQCAQLTKSSGVISRGAAMALLLLRKLDAVLIEVLLVLMAHTEAMRDSARDRR